MGNWVADTGQIASWARWLAGPMFDKELRVTSRRRRYYLLRFAYVGLLIFVTVRFWYTSVYVSGGASAVLQASRLATAGKGVIVTVVWFQFVVAQILAAVLLSDAISSEIRQRTLESLLVTPLGAVHIVLGKLLSRLLLLVLLLAISLPVLAVVRVFGGVPWDYVVSGLCITLSGAVFAGSLSLLYSITYRHAYQAVLVVALWYLVVWGIFAVPVISLSAVGSIRLAPAVYVMSLLNPIPALVTRTQMIRGGAGGGNVPAPVLLHCLVILIAAAACLALAVRRVRRVALALEGRPSNAALIYLHRAPETVVNRKRAARPIRRVEGQPIVWREMRASSWGTGRQVLSSILLWVLVAGLIAPMIASQAMLASGFLIPIWILHWLLVIRLAVTAGGAVTREKEARTWALLLTTPLDDAEIVKSKASAALRRNAGLLVLLLPLYLVLALQGPGQSFPGLIFSTYGGVAGTVVFLLGVGLYLSTRLKTTAGAVVGTLGLYLVPKLFFCGGAGPWLLLAARGPLGAFQGPVTVTLVAVSLIPAAFYAAAGLACLRAATRRLRRDIF